MAEQKQGAKAGRAAKHNAAAAELRERKELRKRRAAIHAAMSEAARLKRSKRKGTRDFEQNMRTLGFEGRGAGGGRGNRGDVLDKYEATRP